MVTDNDIKKLKKVFATKDDLKSFATKDDLKRFATKDDLKRFATKDDLKNTKDDLKNTIDNMVRELLDFLGPTLKKIDDIHNEIRRERIIAGDHEERIEKLEEKVFAHSA